MNLMHLKCPSCGASLDVDNGLDTFFCQYCGAKIALSGQSDAVYKAKANIKITEKVSDTVLNLREKRYQLQQRKMEEQRKKNIRLQRE